MTSSHGILTALIAAATISACMPFEVEVNKRLGAKMEMYISCSDSTDQGSVLRLSSTNATTFRHFEPLLVVGLDHDVTEHELVMQKMSPGEQQATSIYLGARTCRDLEYIDIAKACNVAPLSCNRKNCTTNHSCLLVTPGGMSYTGMKINLATLHEMPSYVEVGIRPPFRDIPTPLELLGCLVPADQEARARLLSSRPPRCGDAPNW